MELNEFIKVFASQFDDTDASEIKENTNFHDLDEWSYIGRIFASHISQSGT